MGHVVHILLKLVLAGYICVLLKYLFCVIYKLIDIFCYTCPRSETVDPDNAEFEVVNFMFSKVRHVCNEGTHASLMHKLSH